MVVQELYKRFLMMINKNDTNEGISIPVGQFVLLYNAEQTRWLAEKLKEDIDNIDANIIELLYVSDFLLKPSGVVDKKLKFIEFLLPDDFFQIYNGFSFADRGKCKDVIIWNWERRPADQSAFRSDENSLPSFDYREAPMVVGGDKMKVYYGDYKLKDTYTNYYRTPKDIDMEGYDHFDGTPSTNINPELDDFNAIEVLSRLATEINRQVENGEGIQYSKDRTNTEFS